MAPDANKVGICDKRNWSISGFKSYLALAIPSLLFTFFEWSTVDVMNIMSGYLSIYHLGCQVIIFNINLQIWSIPFGIQKAICTLIGKQIGDQNIEYANKYYREILKFSFLIFIII